MPPASTAPSSRCRRRLASRRCPSSEAAELIGGLPRGPRAGLIERVRRPAGGRGPPPPRRAADAGAAVVGGRASTAAWWARSLRSDALALAGCRWSGAAPLLDLLERRGASGVRAPRSQRPAALPYAREPGMPPWWPNLGAYPGMSVRAFFAWRALGGRPLARASHLLCDPGRRGTVPGGALAGVQRRDARDRPQPVPGDGVGPGGWRWNARWPPTGSVLGTHIPVISPLSRCRRALAEAGPAAEAAVV